MSVNTNETKIRFYPQSLDNLTEETRFLRGHFNYTMDLISNYTKTENCSMITVSLYYDCCYDSDSRSTCSFVQMVNGNTSISSYFNSSSGGSEYNENSATNSYWTFWNDTVMRTFWSDMKKISVRWTRFKQHADGANNPRDAQGSTELVCNNGTHYLVKCSVSAKDLYGVSLSWFVPNQDFLTPHNKSDWFVNENGTGIGWTYIYVKNETIDALQCHASSSAIWASYLPVPYSGPVPLGSEIPFTLIFAIGLTLVVFLMIGCVACCMFVCRRRDSASISAL